jgi:hypothetical protein
MTHDKTAMRYSPRSPWLAIQVVGSCLAAVYVLAVEGFSFLAAWNTAPLILAVGSALLARGPLATRQVRLGMDVFWASQLVVVLGIHVAWALDLSGLASRSSTAGLIFLVVPIYALVLGLVLAGAAILGEAVISRATRGA